MSKIEFEDRTIKREVVTDSFPKKVASSEEKKEVGTKEKVSSMEVPADLTKMPARDAAKLARIWTKKIEDAVLTRLRTENVPRDTSHMKLVANALLCMGTALSIELGVPLHLHNKVCTYMWQGLRSKAEEVLREGKIDTTLAATLIEECDTLKAEMEGKDK